MSTQSNLKVIIVGGGIGGLTLANCLQHAGIEYVMLEKGSRLDPQVGASIGILPNGARILDQLGCYEDLRAVTVSMATTASHRSDGSIIGDVSDTLALMEQRTGYSVSFLDRQILLQILAKHIVNPDNNILLNKSVSTVEHSEGKAVVRCTDGTSVYGDVVVGVDGVHSQVREAMWKHAIAMGQGKLYQDDQRAMSAEYKCLFGISTSLEGMVPSRTDRTYAKNMSTLSYVGKEGRIFWFVFIKMDKVYYPPDIPRFSADDAAALVDEIGDLAIRENGLVNVRDLYRSHVACSLVAIEEAEYKQWSAGRIVCLGDSIHKMTPNLGAGATSAMESAVILTNVLVELAAKTSTPSVSALEEAFQKYQESRALRVSRAMKFTNTLTRVQALEGFKEYVYTHFIAPLSDDSAAEMFSNFVIGSPRLDFLPAPPRSLQGTMPFNPRHGWGYEELKSRRARRALPLVLLALVYYAHCWLGVQGNQPHLFNPTRSNDYRVTPGNQGASIYEGAMYGIWLLESTRLNNKGSLIQLPILFAFAAQRMGLGVVAPLYFFLLFLRTPVESFRASDNRLTDVAYTATTGPLLLAFAVISEYARLYSTPSTSSPVAGWIASGRPLILSALHFLLTHTLVRSTIRYDRMSAVKRDVPWIRRTVVLFVLVALVNRLYHVYIGDILWTTDLSPLSSIVKSASPPDSFYFTLAVMVWLGLAFQDLYTAGMVNTSLNTIALTCVSALILLGPGALLAVGWLWREEMLINCRHKDAVVGSKPKASTTTA